MSRPLTLLPSNDHLVVAPDRRWPRALLALLLLAAMLLGVLLLVGWPRLKALEARYRVLELRQQVEEMERRRRALQLELERRRDPARLAERARALGLEPPASVATPRAAGGAP